MLGILHKFPTAAITLAYSALGDTKICVTSLALCKIISWGPRGRLMGLPCQIDDEKIIGCLPLEIVRSDCSVRLPNGSFPRNARWTMA